MAQAGGSGIMNERRLVKILRQLGYSNKLARYDGKPERRWFKG